MAILIALLLGLLTATPISSQPDLAIGTEDLAIDQDIAGGYHLWIRKKPEIGSVLITESTADPAKRLDSFALRNPNFEPVNGDEKRMLNGAFLDPAKKLYSLIDSTTERHPVFGDAFHIFIPYIVVYGYPWSREGEIQVLDGTFLNLRAFVKPYGDYGGAYRDNPFVLRVTQKPLAGPPEGNYMSQAVETMKEIAEKGNGQMIYSKGEADLPAKIASAIDGITGDWLDMVLVLDTTGSMENDLPHLKGELVPMIREHTQRFGQFRVGTVFYRDYFEEYLTKAFPFVQDLAQVQAVIDRARAENGRDIPEAIYEALYAAIHAYPWAAPSRLILLVGDAPPHPRPRGSITPEMVFADAAERQIEITTIILPQ